MVKGLTLFRDHFRNFSDQFVLIGGAACDLAMTEAGVAFRATKDLDIVLIIESLTQEFGQAFWQFIQKGGYATQEREDGTKQYYRFARPGNSEFPVLLELFSRVPDGLTIPAGNGLTSLSMGEDVSGLSAILLDEDYFRRKRHSEAQTGRIPPEPNRRPWIFRPHSPESIPGYGKFSACHG